MQYTEKHGLCKPSYEDYADVEILNRNFDTIDSALGLNSDHTAQLRTDLEGQIADSSSFVRVDNDYNSQVGDVYLYDADQGIIPPFMDNVTILSSQGGVTLPAFDTATYTYSFQNWKTSDPYSFVVTRLTRAGSVAPYFATMLIDKDTGIGTLGPWTTPGGSHRFYSGIGQVFKLTDTDFLIPTWRGSTGGNSVVGIVAVTILPTGEIAFSDNGEIESISRTHPIVRFQMLRRSSEYLACVFDTSASSSHRATSIMCASIEGTNLTFGAVRTVASFSSPEIPDNYLACANSNNILIFYSSRLAESSYNYNLTYSGINWVSTDSMSTTNNWAPGVVSRGELVLPIYNGKFMTISGPGNVTILDMSMPFSTRRVIALNRPAITSVVFSDTYTSDGSLYGIVVENGETKLAKFEVGRMLAGETNIQFNSFPGTYSFPTTTHLNALVVDSQNRVRYLRDTEQYLLTSGSSITTSGTVFGIVQRVVGRTKYIDTGRICRNPRGGMTPGETYYIGNDGGLSRSGTRLFGTALQEYYLTNESSTYVVGWFVGDGTYNRTIQLGFTPSAVMLYNSSTTPLGFAMPGRSPSWWSISDSGFIVNPGANTTDTVYSYIAFR